MKQSTKRKLVNTAIFAALLIIEILIGKYAHGFVRAYIGDVLVMPAMYFFVRIFTEKFPRTLPNVIKLRKSQIITGIKNSCDYFLCI